VSIVAPGGLAVGARTAALGGGDLVALDSLLHDDLRYGHSSGRYDSKARYLEKLRTGELAYLEMATIPTDYALLGDVAALWVEGRGRAVTFAVTKTLHVATLTLWSEGRDGRPELIAHQSTPVPSPS
jgi:hypothetical protein